MASELDTLVSLLDQPVNYPQTSHLLSVLHQRCKALCELQQTLAKFVAKKSEIGRCLSAHLGAVEDALEVDDSESNARSNGSEKRKAFGLGASLSHAQNVKKAWTRANEAEKNFCISYERVIGDFEAQWSKNIRVFESWRVPEPQNPHSRLNENCRVLYGLQENLETPQESFSIPQSWVTNFSSPNTSKNPEEVVTEFLRLLLADPYSLGMGIATLEGPSLSNILPTTSSSANSTFSSGSSPFEILVRLVSSAWGPNGVFQLALGIWETAVRELVGREMDFQAPRNDIEDDLSLEESVNSNKNSTETSRPKVERSHSTGNRSREKELEGFLIGMLDILDSLGLSLSTYEQAEDEEEDHTTEKHSVGPLTLCRGTEDILLELLHDSRDITPISARPPDALPKPNSETSSNSWASTMTGTFSTIGSSTAAGIYSVATLSTAGLSTVAEAATSGFGLLPSPLPSTPTSSNTVKHTFSSPSGLGISLGPSSHSFSQPDPTPRAVWNPLTHLLVNAATALLSNLTPSKYRSSIPLVEKLLNHLLSRSFPKESQDSAERQGAGHRKVLLLGIVRWYGFAWLGSKIGRAGSGGAFTPLDVPAGVWMSTFDSKENSSHFFKRRSSVLLDEVFVSPKTSVEILLGLHRFLYGSLVAACGYGDGAEWTEKIEIEGSTSAEQARVAFRDAANTFVQTWSTSSFSTAPDKLENQAVISTTLLSSWEFEVLADSFSSLVLRSRWRPRSGKSPRMSFKKSLAFGSGSPSKQQDSDDEADLADYLAVLLEALIQAGAEPSCMIFTQFIEGKLVVSTRLLEDQILPTKTLEPLSVTSQRSPNQSLSQSPAVSSTGVLRAFPKASELLLLKRAITLLVRSEFLTTGNASNMLERTSQALKNGREHAIARHDYTSQVLLSQALSLVQGFEETQFSMIIRMIAIPYMQHRERDRQASDLVLQRLSELEAQKRWALELACMERHAFDDLRLRSWYSSVKGSELGRQVRKRLTSSLRNARTTKEQLDAQAKVLEWSASFGLPSFTRAPESLFEEALMVVETAVSIAMEPGTFYSSPYWQRERQVVDKLLASRPKGTPSLGETIFSSGTTILTAPLALAAGLNSGFSLSSSSSPVIGGEAAVETPVDVVLSFGAASPTLLKKNEANTAYSNAVDEHLRRCAIKLTAYLWSDVLLNLVGFRDFEGRPYGTDAWFQEFGSPLSPLPRATPEELEQKGIVEAVPRVYLPNTTRVSPFYKQLLKRFTVHPSPNAKLNILFELERLVADELGGPTVIQFDIDSEEEDNSGAQDAKRAKHFKFHGRVQKKIASAASPFFKLFENSDRELHQDSANNLEELFEDPGRAKKTTAEDQSIKSEPSSEMLGLNLKEDEQVPANTDDMLLQLEQILRHTRPSNLFQNLQLVGWLTSPHVLDSQMSGKAYWDVGLAALSIRKDVIENWGGVLERVHSALADGTEEGKELAERLVLIAAKEECSDAIKLLQSMGLKDINTS